ncbi:MAG: L,D-transpeptidase family protein [Acidobacteriota bacterium]
MKKRKTTRRIILLIILCAIIWSASEWLVPLLDGSQSPPLDPTGKGAETLLFAARREGAEQLYPQRFMACQDALKEARFETNLQLASQWGTRDFVRPQRLLDEAQAQAFGLWKDAVEHRREVRPEAEAMIARADDSLQRSEEVADLSRQDYYTRGHLATAFMLLHQAQSYYGAGQYDRALSAASSSLENSSRALSRSREYLERFDDPHHLRLWELWIREAVASSRSTGIAFVVIKEKHRLDVYKNGRLAQSFPVDLGANSVSQKERAGDRATPEGLYRIIRKKGRGATKYGLALLLNYPNEEDRRRFAEMKARGQLTRRTGIGGLIEIHGTGGRGYDWTDGCIAPNDENMERLYHEAVIGTVVAIVGSDGSGGPIRSALMETRR